MNRRHVRTFLASMLASSMLYYSSAWAVLLCCHVDEQGSHEEVATTLDLAPSQIDCLDFAHKVEVLAAPTSPPQIHRGTATLSPYAGDVLVVKSLIQGDKQALLRNIFTRGASLIEPADPPLYLSLSSLRI